MIRKKVPMRKAVLAICVVILTGCVNTSERIDAQYSESDIESTVEKTTIEETTTQEETQETEEEWEEIKHEEYGEDGEEISFRLSQNSEGEFKLNIVGTVDENWKAAYIFTIYATIIADENIKETLNPVLIMMNDNVFLSSALSYRNVEGGTEIINTSDWIVENISDGYDENEAEELKDRIMNYFYDFLELE